MKNLNKLVFFCLVVIISSLSVIFLLKENSEEVDEPLEVLRFQNGYHLDILQIKFGNEIFIDRSSDFVGIKTDELSLLGGFNFDSLTTEEVNRKWLSSVFNLRTDALLIEARAFDSIGNVIPSPSFLGVQDNVREVNFKNNGVITNISNNRATLKWWLEIDLGDGTFRPFYGPLTVSKVHGNSINWNHFVPSKKLRLRGCIGEQQSNIVEIDISDLRQSSLEPIGSEVIPAVRESGDYTLTLSKVDFSNNPHFFYNIRSNVREQSDDAWDIVGYRIIGDDLGNRAPPFKYVRLPEAKQLLFDIKIEQSEHYRWTDSEVYFFAEGYIREDGIKFDVTGFDAAPLTSFSWEAIECELIDGGLTLELKGGAGKDDWLRFCKGHLVIFVEDSIYSRKGNVVLEESSVADGVFHSRMRFEGVDFTSKFRLALALPNSTEFRFNFSLPGQARAEHTIKIR